MNTNHERKNNQLSDTLATFFLKKHQSGTYQADFTVYDGSVRYLAVVHDGVAYPLLFTMLPKKGTSNTQERIGNATSVF